MTFYFGYFYAILLIMINTLKKRDFTSELEIKTTRSSGPGGQNVNKVNTKIVLRFNVLNSQLLSSNEKQLIIAKLKHKLSTDLELIISNQESRSQLKNKEKAIEQFYKLMALALTLPKKRVATKRTKASVERRLSSKKQQSLKKANRRFKDM